MNSVLELGQQDSVGILESNSFSADNIDSLSDELKDLVQRREVLGPCYRIFYQEPLHLVRGRGARLFDAQGTEYLDMYNNIPSIGHSNPVVTEAVTQQLSLINTHTRYLHQNILDYAEALLKTMPPEIDRIMFMCSGSEANDFAVRCAQAYTGGKGIIVTSEAYHGNTDLISGLSPSIGANAPLNKSTYVIDSPFLYCEHLDSLGAIMCEQIADQIEAMHKDGITFAGVLFDSIFSSDGVFPADTQFLKDVVALVHDEGGVFIADEVQPGFCRTGGAFWGFQNHGIVPDIVTMGKPMANGIACSGVAVRYEILEAFAQVSPYFNTFAGNPVAMAAAQAVLDYLTANNMLDHVANMGQALKDALIELKEAYPIIGTVRGSGLFIGADITLPHSQSPDRGTAVRLIEILRENKVLISLCGPYGNVLKIRPPLVFNELDLAFFVKAFKDSLESL